MSYYDANLLDRHAYLDSAVHRLDPRAKVLATLVFIVTVVSFGKYELAPLMPFIAFPMAMAIIGFVPAGLLFKRLLVASPFVVAVGMFNPLFDRSVVLELFGLKITGGWVSFASIVLRGFLCIGAAVVLVATTSFPRITEALARMGVPRALVVQLILLYRYLFLLVGEARRMNRARTLRSVSSKNPLRVAGSILSVLLMRTLDRGEAVWLAMKARGFEGELKTARRMEWRWADSALVAAVAVSCALLRWLPITDVAGRLWVR